MNRSKQQEAIQLFRAKGLLRPCEMERAGLSRGLLYQMVVDGTVLRSGRGIYTLADMALSENHSYAEAVKRVPNGIICLLSALRFHKITMQNPTEVWVAVPHGSWRSQARGLKLRVVQYSGSALTDGVKSHQIEGVTVPVTSVARTIVDCFKFRNKIGTDVAWEALREAWGKKLFKMDELWSHGRTLRMTRVMMPYLEAMT